MPSVPPTCWLALMLAACSGGASPDGPTPAPAQANPGRWPACDPSATAQRISFVHVNDLHATYAPDPDDGVSPVARIRGYVEQVQSEHNPYTVFTDGGDDHEKGSVAEVLSQGLATVEVTEALRFDARVLGNHDFAWGEQAALRFSRDPHAIVLASNTRYQGDRPEDWGALRWGVLEVGCVKLGFFGFVSEPWDECNELGEGDFLDGGGLRTRYDHAAQARHLLAEHGDEVDLVVMLSHLGSSADAALAAAVPEIDLVLGGHDHKVLTTPQRSGDALIVQAGAEAVWIAHLDVTVDLASGTITDRDFRLVANRGEGELPRVDAPTQRAVEDIMARHAPEARAALTRLRRDHDEGSIAALTARAAVEQLEVDAALVELSTVWGPWSAGPLTQQDLLDTYKVERQPPGTPSWNAFAQVEIGGGALQAIAASVPPTWAYHGPERIDPDGRYRFALQRCAAHNPERLWPGLSFTGLTEAGETWELLADYGARRQARGLYLDADEPLR
jgi:5'-nucleotidase/UDP-sugar diphosphatase